MPKHDVVYIQELLRDIAYLGGLFTSKGDSDSTTYLRIRMMDGEPVERIYNLFGGNFRGPYKDSVGHKRTWYEWSINDIDTFRALSSLMLPWLSQRLRAQVEEVLEFVDSKAVSPILGGGAPGTVD